MLQYWLWLSEKACVSKVRRLALLRQLGSVDAIYFANESDLSHVPELTQEELGGLLDKDLTHANEILNQCYELDIRLLTWQDAQYPPALRNIADPPIVLYYRGRLPAFGTAPALALIGARKASAAGLLAAKRMGYQLGEAWDTQITVKNEGTVDVDAHTLHVDFVAADESLHFWEASTVNHSARR